VTKGGAARWACGTGTGALQISRLRSVENEGDKGGVATKGETSKQRESSIPGLAGLGRAHRRSLGSPRFPVESCGFGQLHEVLFKENHIRGRW
jgi:hypothetical protein